MIPEARVKADEFRVSAEEVIRILRNGGPRALFRIYGRRLALLFMRYFCAHGIARWEAHVEARRAGNHRDLLRDFGVAKLVCVRCGAVLELGSVGDYLISLSDATDPVWLKAGDSLVVAGDRIISTAGYR